MVPLLLIQWLLFASQSTASGGSQSHPGPSVSYQSISVQHVTILSYRSFNDTRAALETTLPPLNTTYQSLLEAGDIAAGAAALEALAPLSIFLSRDHGLLLRIYGLQRKAIQYDIGDPFTASKMTRHELGGAQYAPIRVLLEERTEEEGGGVVFHYDRPLSVFGQFGNPAVDEVAGMLDTELREALMAAAGITA